MTTMNEWLGPLMQTAVLGNTVLTWLTAAGILLLILSAFWVFRAIVAKRIQSLGTRYRTVVGDLMVRLATHVALGPVLAIAIYAASRRLVLDPDARTFLKWVLVVGLAFQAAAWGRQTILHLVDLFLKRSLSRNGRQDAALVTTMEAVKFGALLALYAVVVLLAASNMGINITAMVAGLGVGGIAVALAMQNILGDLFGALSIVLDKPFVVGDFVVVGDKMGTVERIGLKTTRLRALAGEQLVFSNTDLLASRIQNYKRMAERRVEFQIGTVYDLAPEQVEAIAAMLREIVVSQKQVRFDRAHFKRFGASSLDFEVVYFVLSADFNTYMDIQQSINLEILRRFAASGIGFAYPTQTVYLARPGARSAPSDGEAYDARAEPSGARRA